MEKKLLDQLIALGVNRPIQAYRMVGNRRIEVHCLGDYTPTVYDLGIDAVDDAGDDVPDDDLDSMKVADLRKVAKRLSIKVSGLRKADLIDAIIEAYE